MSEWNRQEFLKSHVAMGEDVESSRFPELSTLSPAFFYQFVPVAKAPEKPEVVFIPRSLGTDLELTGMLASWNLLWEAGQYRKEAYPWIRGRESPAITSWLERIKETNTCTCLLTQTRSTLPTRPCTTCFRRGCLIGMDYRLCGVHYGR
jgi:hypothetical protein